MDNIIGTSTLSRDFCCLGALVVARWRFGERSEKIKDFFFVDKKKDLKKCWKLHVGRVEEAPFVGSIKKIKGLKNKIFT